MSSDSKPKDCDHGEYKEMTHPTDCLLLLLSIHKNKIERTKIKKARKEQKTAKQPSI